LKDNKEKLYALIIIVFTIILIMMSYYIYKLKFQYEEANSTLTADISKIHRMLGAIMTDLTNLKSNIDTNNAISKASPPSDTIQFDNPSTDGLFMISEDKAINIWKQYLTDLQTIDNYKIGNYKITNTELADKSPNNYLDTKSVDKYGMQHATFTRKCYVITCTYGIVNDVIIGYVDAYTGKIIGGDFFGD